MTGRERRLGRLNQDGVWIMVPMDHGLTMGPLPGLQDPGATMEVLAAVATCTAVHRGMVRRMPAGPGVLLHVSAGTDRSLDPSERRLVATVEDAVRLGCDGISIHVNLGCATEAAQLADLGAVAADCDRWGLPLVAMVYPKGRGSKGTEPELVAHAARLAAEAGADAVKVPYTGDQETFRDVVAGAGIPVLVAGGARRDPQFLLSDLRHARAAGAAGVSIGRNVWQADHPAAAARAVADVFR